MRLRRTFVRTGNDYAPQPATVSITGMPAGTVPTAADGLAGIATSSMHA
jgi:hypothetical protein